MSHAAQPSDTPRHSTVLRGSVRTTLSRETANHFNLTTYRQAKAANRNLPMSSSKTRDLNTSTSRFALGGQTSLRGHR